MMRALALLVMLSGCASAQHDELRAWLSPLCVLNCFNSVTYAPGVKALDASTGAVPKHDDLLR